MTNNIVPVSDIERMANAVAKSNLFGVKTADQAMALMLIAQAEGLHPAIAARDYHVINGKPALKADAMFARFQQAGGKVVWKDYTDAKVSAVFSHPQGGSVEIAWTIEMAKKANLTGKDTWKNYPRQMLRARVISEGIRTVYPGVAVGVYTPEEVQDFAPAGAGPVIEGEIVETPKAASPFKTATARKTFHENVRNAMDGALNLEELQTIRELNKPKFDEMRASGNEHDLLSVEELAKHYSLIAGRIRASDYSTVDTEIGEREAAFADRAPYPAYNGFEEPRHPKD